MRTVKNKNLIPNRLVLLIGAFMVLFLSNARASIVASWTNDQVAYGGVVMSGFSIPDFIGGNYYDVGPGSFIPNSLNYNNARSSVYDTINSSGSLSSSWDGTTFSIVMNASANLPSNYMSDGAAFFGDAYAGENFGVFFTLDAAYNVVLTSSYSASGQLYSAVGSGYVESSSGPAATGGLSLLNGSSLFNYNFGQCGPTTMLDPGTYAFGGQVSSQVYGADAQYGSQIGGLSMSLSFAAVPEPSTYALFGIGALILGAALRRKWACTLVGECKKD